MTKEIAVETTDTSAISLMTGYSTTTKTGAEAISTMEFTYHFTFEHSWDHTEVRSTKVTKSQVVNFEQSYIGEPGFDTYVTLEVIIAKIPPKLYSTTTTRWYREELSDCVADGGLWKRDEPLSINITGSFYSSLILKIERKERPKSTTDRVVDGIQQKSNEAIEKAQELTHDASNKIPKYGKDAGKMFGNVMPRLGQ